jgi:hypothetical protein
MKPTIFSFSYNGGVLITCFAKGIIPNDYFGRNSGGKGRWSRSGIEPGKHHHPVDCAAAGKPPASQNGPQLLVAGRGRQASGPIFLSPIFLSAAWNRRKASVVNVSFFT